MPILMNTRRYIQWRINIYIYCARWKPNCASAKSHSSPVWQFNEYNLPTSCRPWRMHHLFTAGVLCWAIFELSHSTFKQIQINSPRKRLKAQHSSLFSCISIKIVSTRKSGLYFERDAARGWHATYIFRIVIIIIIGNKNRERSTHKSVSHKTQNTQICAITTIHMLQQHPIHLIVFAFGCAPRAPPQYTANYH